MNSLNKETLSEQIYNILKNDIINQNIKCGEKLTLKVLKEKFNVSSTPIREALTKLTQDNLVTYYSNIGVKVIELNENDLFELYQFIGELDSLALKFSFNSKYKESLIKDLKENIEKNVMFIEKNDFEQADKISDQFHLIFYKYCQNSRLVDAYKKVFLQISIFTNKYVFDENYQYILLNAHKDIYNYIIKDDCESACKCMIEHLNKSYKFILDKISFEK